MVYRAFAPSYQPSGMSMYDKLKDRERSMELRGLAYPAPTGSKELGSLYGYDGTYLGPEAQNINFTSGAISGLSKRLGTMLEGVGSRLGRNLGVTSGYRSPTYNAKVGGAKKSYHMKHDAADIDMTGMSVAERKQLVQALSEAGAGGLITYSKHPNMLHVDLRPRDPKSPPHFMHDKTSKKMKSAPGWFQEVAASAGGYHPVFSGVDTPANTWGKVASSLKDFMARAAAPAAAGGGIIAATAPAQAANVPTPASRPPSYNPTSIAARLGQPDVSVSRPYSPAPDYSSRISQAVTAPTVMARDTLSRMTSPTSIASGDYGLSGILGGTSAKTGRVSLSPGDLAEISKHEAQVDPQRNVNHITKEDIGWGDTSANSGMRNYVNNLSRTVPDTAPDYSQNTTAKTGRVPASSLVPSSVQSYTPTKAVSDVQTKPTTAQEPGTLGIRDMATGGLGILTGGLSNTVGDAIGAGLNALKANPVEALAPARNVAPPYDDAYAANAVQPKEETQFPAAPAPYEPSLLNRAYNSPVLKNALLGGILGGPIGAAMGIGRGMMQAAGPFGGLIPKSEQTNIGYGSQAINNAMYGPRGATAYSTSAPNTSVTSRGPNMGYDLTNKYGAVTHYDKNGNITATPYSGIGGGILSGLFGGGRGGFTQAEHDYANSHAGLF